MATDQGGASIWLRKDKLLIVSASMVGGAYRDDLGAWSGLCVEDFDAFFGLIAWTRPDDDLGRALKDALRMSRLNVPRPAAWANGLGSDKAETDARLAAAFGLGSARRLYEGMRSPGAEWARGVVTLYPSRRRPGGRFEGFEPAWADLHQPVSLPFTSGDTEIGRAIRTCIDRCA
jgi:hypothetical protein